MAVFPLICLLHPRAHAWASRELSSTCPHVLVLPSAAPARCGGAGQVAPEIWWSVFVRGRPDLRAWRETHGRDQMRALLLARSERRLPR